MADRGKGFCGSKSNSFKDWAAVLGITALLGLGGGALGYASTEVPDAADSHIATQAEMPEVMVSDPGDVLTPEDEARLKRDAERLDRPDTVKTLHYIALTENRDNVNDSVENFLRDNFPDQIGNKKYADGVLIVGTDVVGRHNFIVAGEDVADQLYIRKDQRLGDALEAMKPGLRDNNIPGGFFAGANVATDIEAAQNYPVERAESEQGNTTVGYGLAAGAAGLAGGSMTAIRRNKRRKQIAQAREDHAIVANEFTGLSQRLDELDIRANSVSSAFADTELREQWEEVRDRFLGLHNVTQLGVDTDRQAWENHEALEEAAATVTDTGHAEENINRLFNAERGDVATRRSILLDIRTDAQNARREVKDEEIKRDLQALEDRIEELDRNAAAPDFIDQFVILLRDYSTLLDEVKRREFSDVPEHTQLDSPTITQPGFIYGTYVPYVHMSSWHSSNVAAEQQAQSSASSSSSSINTSYSSGFSGAGGSSSY